MVTIQKQFDNNFDIIFLLKNTIFINSCHKFIFMLIEIYLKSVIKTFKYRLLVFNFSAFIPNIKVYNEMKLILIFFYVFKNS
jgi:hypothetical protein